MSWWCGLVFHISYIICWPTHVKCIWSLHHGKSTIKIHKLLMNCFKRILSFIAIITIKAMCIQFAEHLSRVRHPNFQQVHVHKNIEWTLWTASEIPNFQNINSTLTIFIFYFGFRLTCLVCEDVSRNSYFKNASSLIKCHTT